MRNEHKIEKSLKTTNVDRQSKTSINWYKQQLKNVKGGKQLQDKKIASPTRSNQKPFIGGMFQFVYDAKTKEKLPFWDAFPLVIIVNVYDDGVLGLNLHYLPPQMRAKILDILMTYEKTIKTGSNGIRTYMQLSYNMLSRLPEDIQFCLKKYLYTHIQSKVIRIESEYWDKVAFLPTQRFQKATAQTVWKEYKKWR